tara:strand:+ start:210 stop:866 length:657 start_codon:yes stop_codon:yes gene_type:complete
MANQFTNEPQGNDVEKAAEQINSEARDRVDAAQKDVEQTVKDTPQKVEEFVNDERMGTAPRSKGIATEKLKDRDKKQKSKKQEKFEVDLDNYMEFVDKVTSNASKDYNALLARYEELKEEGCKIQRLDTAASGMCSEAGEFMEIVKKLKFQGKPYNQGNKEHLEKELGDIMWYVAQAALALDLRLDEVIYTNTLKLAARYPGEMFNVDYSENRAPGDI